MGPLLGYSVSLGDMRTLYTRNGFANLDKVIKDHIDGWVAADMAIRALDNVFFYLDAANYDEHQAIKKLETMDKDPNVEIVGALI